MCLALKSSLEIQKNRLCSNEFDNNNNLYTYYNWNYYNNIEHIANNLSESFNNYLKNLFKTYFL